MFNLFPFNYYVGDDGYNGFVFPNSDILGFGIPDVYILM